MQLGTEAAAVILQRYPDYGKTPPEYLASVAELLSDYSPELLRALTDKHLGINSVCKFLPTHADFKDFADRWHQRQIDKAYNPRDGREPEPTSVQGKFRPFPKLWAAFKDEPDLLEGHTFDVLFDASRWLAMEGVTAARKILTEAKKRAA